MQLPLHTKAHKGEIATTTPNYKPVTSGKLSNPYLHLPQSNLIDRNIYILDVPQQNNLSSNVLMHKNPPTRNHMLCNNYRQTHKSSNLLYKARLHAQKGGGDKSITLKTHQNFSNLCFPHMSSRGKAVLEAIMRSPIDTNMEDIEDTMVI